jgi:hypothetical protein
MWIQLRCNVSSMVVHGLIGANTMELFVFKKWYLHKLGTWEYAWIMWIISNWLLIIGGLSTCLHVNLFGIHPISMFSNWWQWTIETLIRFYTIISMLSFPKFMPRVHYFVPLHMCIQVCQKVSNGGWCYT